MKKKYSRHDLKVEIAKWVTLIDSFDSAEFGKKVTIAACDEVAKDWLKIHKMAKSLDISDKTLYDLVENAYDAI